jgi:hypothetical protein
MQNGFIRKTYIQLFSFFILLNAIFLICWFAIPSLGMDWRVLAGGNTILFVVGIISVNMSSKALTHKNVQGFLRLVYGSFLLKFFVLSVSAFVYILLLKKQINKPALFGCFGLYFIYTFIELRSVMKQSKKSNA